jgi:hypothetical protein
VARCRAGRGGSFHMPSSDYFRRQADICRRLSLIASSEEAVNWLVQMAQDYQAKADSLAEPELKIVAQGTASACFSREA